MPQINIKNLQKSFGDKDVLKNITFSVDDGERIGIVGLNGSGKTTLLKIIAGIDKKDAGDMQISKNISIGLLNQDNEDALQSSYYDSLLSIDKKYLKMLNITDEYGLNPYCLSGGEITKISLCLLLSKNPNILILDEPTNNLDYHGINTLIDLLDLYNGTIITVSHDRYFLDRLVSKIVEIENGVSTLFNGNYTHYRDEKQRLFSETMHRYEEGVKEQKNVEKSIKKLKDWSGKAHRDSTKKDANGDPKMGKKEYHRAKAKKMDKKIKSDIKRLESMIEKSEPRPKEEKKVYFNLLKSSSKGKRILEANDISKSFDNVTLFEKSSFFMCRGEKVAIFGPNGCGKSTFIAMLKGDMATDTGNIWISPGANAYYLDQKFDSLPQDKKVIDYLTNKKPDLSGDDRTLLFNLGITSRHLNQSIKSLSYGEQMKLKFIAPILENKDFIILDEPTNHIDLFTRDMLEKTLKDYTGSLLIVSHDIYFLSNVCDKVIVFEDGRIRRLEKSFKDYLESPI